MPSIQAGLSIIDLVVTVSNFYKAREAITMINDRKVWRGMFKEYITDLLERMAIYAEKITPSETGHLAKAHMWKYDSHRMKGSVFLNPRAPWLEGRRTIRWPHIYGTYVHARGGESAFYTRTQEHFHAEILDGLHARIDELPWPSESGSVRDLLGDLAKKAAKAFIQNL